MKSWQQEIDDLERKRLQERRKIERLRERIAIADDMQPELRTMRLDLMEAQEKLKTLEDGIRVQKGQWLFESLLSLDYHVPTMFFRNFSTKEKIGAFLLHGPEDGHHAYRGYSLWMLLNRLMRYLPVGFGKKVIRRNITDDTLGHDTETLWRSLATNVELGFSATHKEIISGVCQVLKTEHVVLIVKGIHRLVSSQLDALILNFWGELAQGVQRAHEGPCLLLLFLFDKTGTAKQLYSQYFEQQGEAWSPNGSWQPTLPIRLTVAPQFSPRDLEVWLEVHTGDLFHVLHHDLTQGPLTDRVQRVLDQSNNGHPDFVLSHIYHICGHQMEGMEGMEQWLVF